MGIGLEQWRAAIGLYNAGRPRSHSLLYCDRTNLESTLDLLMQLASTDPKAAFTFAKAIGISVDQLCALIFLKDGRKIRSLRHQSNYLSCSRAWPAESSYLRRLLVLFTASLMTALMLLILLSGDVERNPGPDIDGESD